MADVQKWYVDALGNQFSLCGGMPNENWIEVSGPRPHEDMDWSGDAWAVNINKLRAKRIAELTARYDSALNEGMAYQGKILQIRDGAQPDQYGRFPNDQANIIAMGAKARDARDGHWAWPPDFAWRMKDNSILPLPTANDMISMDLEAATEVYRLRQVRWTHAAQIAALNTVEAVLAYDIETGWIGE